MQRLVSDWVSGPDSARPDLWFTYHVYYKAPDWLGPGACAALGIPYVIAEASFAPKRAGGPWTLGHEAAREAIARADLVLAPTRHDMECLRPLLTAPDRIEHLPPFLDARPFHDALRVRAAHRARLAGAHRLDAALPWIVVAAMMRAGDKLASYRELAAALALLGDLPWQMVIVGDGPARAEVAAALNQAAPGRTRFLGELSGADLAAAYAACDLFLWPAVNEAYGMAMLEAQAAGIPVISCALRGVPDVVCDGQTGLLVPPHDPQALAATARTLLLDPERRRAMGERSQAWVAGERSLETAAARLDRALAGVVARAGAH
jgi:glycosyltransferase involved in cell wall biosynthesis